LTYTINGIDLGQVQTEEHDQRSELDTEAYPMSGSKDMEAIDAGNVIRTITVEGLLVDTKANIMNNLVQPIDALQNGDQMAITFHSDMWDLTTAGDYTNGNFSVKVQSFKPKIHIGEETAVTYTLVLIESI
jgi:hypothetical protein